MASIFASAATTNAPTLNKTPKKIPQQNTANATLGQGHTPTLRIGSTPIRPPAGVNASNVGVGGFQQWGAGGYKIPAAPKPTSIIDQAIAGHPSWGAGQGTPPQQGGPNAPASAGGAGGGGGGGGGGGAPTYAIPTVPEDETAKTLAAANYTTETGAANNAIQQAAMAYGDPSIMSQWGLGTTVDPNSALATAAREHQQATDQENATTETAGNFFTSVHDKAQAILDNNQMLADTAGYTAYQKALGDYTTAMTNAQIKRDSAINNANLDERNKAISTLPTATGATAPSQSGKNTKTNTKAGATPKAPKGGKTSVRKVTLPKVGKGPGVKKVSSKATVPRKVK